MRKYEMISKHNVLLSLLVVHIPDMQEKALSALNKIL